SSVLRILHAHKFHPYHSHRHQALEDRDYNVREAYCTWLLTAIDRDPNFLSRILWSDEAQFSRDGVVNTHNMHYWADENPRWLSKQHTRCSGEPTFGVESSVIGL